MTPRDAGYSDGYNGTPGKSENRTWSENEYDEYLQGYHEGRWDAKDDWFASREA